MAIEKKNPLPPGTYWIDVHRDHSGFLKWLKSPGVRELKRTEGKDFNWWFLFEVTQPVARWPITVRVGLPTIAKQGAKTTKAKTQKRPKPKGVAEYWGDEVKDFATTPVGLVMIVVALLALSRK